MGNRSNFYHEPGWSVAIGDETGLIHLYGPDGEYRASYRDGKIIQLVTPKDSKAMVDRVLKAKKDQAND
jgi:hypothetical protein